MSYTVRSAEIWVADVRHKPGMVARLLEALTNAGANLEFVIGRRVTEDTSRIFVAPLRGAKEKRAAAEAGFVPAAGLHAIRVEGPDRTGLGSDITRAIAAANLNLRGLSAATIGRKSVIYLAFESQPEADLGTKIVRRAAAKR